MLRFPVEPVLTVLSSIAYFWDLRRAETRFLATALRAGLNLPTALELLTTTGLGPRMPLKTTGLELPSFMETPLVAGSAWMATVLELAIPEYLRVFLFLRLAGCLEN